MNTLQKKFARRVTHPLLMRLYMLTQLPMGLLSGLRVRSIDENKTVVSVPFKYLNKNPFRSIYFAVQAMAAEMSTATSCLLAVQGHKPSVAFIIVDLKAEFTKKATGRVYFTCEDNQKAFEAVKKCIETGEATQAAFKTVGRMKDGTEVSSFTFTWSFKQRSS
jgi:hypothetical protein